MCSLEFIEICLKSKPKTILQLERTAYVYVG